MQIIAANLRKAACYLERKTLRVACLAKRTPHGHQTQRRAAVRQRSRRLVHRRCAHRSACSAAPEPARVALALVTFEPGARTAWHTHPLGQTLIVTAGCGWVQREGGPIEEIRPGDVVWFPPGEKHWHGAAPTTAMSHIAIQEKLDGKAVDWMEKVSDEQYRRSRTMNFGDDYVKATMLYGPRDVRYEEVPEPKILKPTDAIIRLSATCICGSDLWPFRGLNEVKAPMAMGHEYCGIVEEVGSAVKTVRRASSSSAPSASPTTPARIAASAFSLPASSANS